MPPAACSTAILMLIMLSGLAVMAIVRSTGRLAARRFPATPSQGEPRRRRPALPGRRGAVVGGDKEAGKVRSEMNGPGGLSLDAWMVACRDSPRYAGRGGGQAPQGHFHGVPFQGGSRS